MITAIAGEVVEKLATHRHIKHFRTDLHKYIDLSFNHVKDVPETMNAARLEISADKDQEVPKMPETRARAAESARPSFVIGPNTIPLNTARLEGFTNMKIDVDPKFDKTNYQTEIMIEIEQKPFRIIADSGATSSGINLFVVKELNLLASMKPTEYNRTSSGKVEKALGTEEVSLRIGPIVVKTDMVVMPSGCGYNMLLSDELMTTLRVDIMRSLKVVRFQVGDCVTSVPMLPRETRASNPVEVYFKVDCSDPWINNKPPIIEVEAKND
jgi:hypothetical protein